MNRCFPLAILVVATLSSPDAFADVNRWTTHGPQTGGYIRNMAIDAADSNLVYAHLATNVYDSRFLRSTDGGASWTSADSPCAWIAADPVDAGVVYTIKGYYGAYEAGGEVRRSTDGGSTWRTIELSDVKAVAIDPADHRRVYAAGLSAIYRSLDSGASWQQVYDKPVEYDIQQFLFGPDGHGYIVARGCCSSTFLKSTDGVAWNVSSYPGGRLVLDPTNPMIQYANSTDGTYRTTDEGATWTLMSPSVGSGSIFVTPNGSVLYLSNSSGFYRSADSGSTWTLVNSAFKPTDLLFDPRQPERFFSWNLAGIRVTTNGGVDWADSTNGIVNSEVTSIAVDPLAPSTVYAGAGGFKSADGGTTWSSIRPGCTSFAADRQNPANLYCIENGVVLRSADRGATWASTGVPASAIAVDPATPSVVYAAAGSSMNRSTDAGGSWTQSALDSPCARPVSIAVAPSRAQTVYLVGPSGFGRSDDSGASWNCTSWIYGVLGVAIDSQDANVVYAIMGNGKWLYRSSDGGRTWSAIVKSGVGAVTTDPTAANVLYIGTDEVPYGILLTAQSAPDAHAQLFGGYDSSEHVYRSINRGAKWTPLANAIEHADGIRTIAFAPSDPSVIYAGTKSSGVYSIKLQPLPGDANNDYAVTPADVFVLVNALFAGGPAAPAVADANGDHVVDAADVFYLINYLFAGGPAPVGN